MSLLLYPMSRPYPREVPSIIVLQAAAPNVRNSISWILYVFAHFVK